MKFLLDMGISPRLADFLRSSNHEAVHLNDEGLGELGDHDILDKARNGGYVLLAHDLDFADLLAATGEQLPSVVIFRLRNMTPESVTTALERVLSTTQEALKEGAIVSVTESLVRIRPLPIKPAD